MDRRDYHAAVPESCEIAEGEHELNAHELLKAIARPIRIAAREGLNTDRLVSAPNKSRGYEKMLEELIKDGMPKWLHNCRWEFRQQ